MRYAASVLGVAYAIVAFGVTGLKGIPGELRLFAVDPTSTDLHTR